MRNRSYFVSFFCSDQEGEPEDVTWRPESCYMTRDAGFQGLIDIEDILAHIRNSTGRNKVVILNVQFLSTESLWQYFVRKMREWA